MNDVLQEKLNLMGEYYEYLLQCTSTGGRKHNYERMLDIYYSDEKNLSKYWLLDEHAKNYTKRFVFNPIQYEVNLTPKDIKEISGLYLVCSVHTNPHTKEIFYWVKVGQSSQLYSRLSAYYTYNPMPWIQSTYELPKDQLDACETACHKKLQKIAVANTVKGNEWIGVSREDYLEICEKGFDYFANEITWAKIFSNNPKRR